LNSDINKKGPDRSSRYSFNRMEFSGSLGDLGTLLPISIGMIMINGLSPTGLFISIGLFYILSGHYYGVTVSVQPMKVVGAYAIAMGITAPQIAASGLLIGLILLIIGGSGAISRVGTFIPKSVIRGVQISTGTLLMIQGVKFMIGTSSFQAMQGAAEPYLNIQSIGMVPIGIILGTLAGLITLFFLENKKIPAGILVILIGSLTGLVLGNTESFNTFKAGLFLPELIPYGFPSETDFSFALLILVLPQIPMTIGNAVIANADLSRQYFGNKSDKVTYKSLCYSMGIANILTFLIGGMPLCHGAGGLASHYRFGARTAGSNLIVVEFHMYSFSDIILNR